MMTVKELRQKALHKYSLHVGYSWLISIFGCFAAAGILFIFGYFTSLIFIPAGLLVLPILFSAICAHRALHFKKEPEFKRIFTYFKAFYSREFRSSFNFIFSILKSLLVGIVVYLIAAPVTFFSFKNSSLTFESTINDLLSLLNTMSLDDGQLNAILAKNDYELIHYFQTVLIPCSIVFFVAIFFFMSVASFSIYNRFEADKLSMPFAVSLSKVTIKSHPKEFYKYYFGLNWPIYVIIILCAGAGGFLSYCLNSVSVMPYSLIIPFGVIGMMLFYPFFLNNNEVIHEEFDAYYKESTKKMSDDLLQAINEQQIFNEEQKQAIEQALDQLKKNDSRVVNSDEDKEKDPPSSES